jgi:hypothetical protein
MRPAPVERLVDRMRDGGERALAPADDPVVDLEPPTYHTFDDRAAGAFHRVPRQRLPDRRDPADR